MWLFTNFGFFSVVQYKNAKDLLFVRARSRSDLERLISSYGALVGRTSADIVETPDADYCCRILVEKSKWAAVMSAATEDIDYTNFKNSVHEKQGHDRASVYMDVWSTMYSMQSSEMKSKSEESLYTYLHSWYSSK